ncbi:MAG: AI-2E family transporter, partial [Bacteroidota bacterium]
MLRNTFLLLFFLLALFIFLAWLFVDILIYIVIAVVISSILRPLTQYIANAQFFEIRVPRVVAVLMSFAIFIMLLSSFVILFIPLISEQIEVLSKVDYNDLYDNVTLPLGRFEEFLISNGLTSESPGFLVNTLRESVLGFFTNIQFATLLNNLISVTGNIFIGVLAVTFITFFLLYEMGAMRAKLLSLVPNRYFEVTIAAYSKIERLLSNYLIGLLFQMFAIFSIASLGLSILGIKYALTIALFAAVANLIPYLGPILGGSFGIIVGISTGATELVTTQDYLFLVLKIASVFAVVQVTDNVVLQPLIFSKSVKAHPLEIFIIIFAGASLAGIPGMIAAIPVYTILRVAIL